MNDITNPLDYIGKTVCTKNKPHNGKFVVHSITKYNKVGYHSRDTRDYASSFGNDFIVLVGKSSDGANHDLPLLLVELVPDKPREVIVKLNKSYDAIITKDEIKVGCQTFPITVLKEMQEALDGLNEVEVVRTLKNVKKGDRVRSLTTTYLRDKGEVFTVKEIDGDIFLITSPAHGILSYSRFGVWDFEIIP
jgi:hypothetical protein